MKPILPERTFSVVPDASGAGSQKNRFSYILPLLIIFLILHPLTALTKQGQSAFYTLHVSSSRQMKDTREELSRFQKLGIHVFYRYEEVKDKGMWYRVYLGKYASSIEARKAGKKFKQRGLISYALVRKFKPEVEPLSFYTLHVSSFRQMKNAAAELSRFEKSGADGFYRREKVKDTGMWYRLYLGKYASIKEARKAGEEFKQRGLISYALVKRFKPEVASAFKIARIEAFPSYAELKKLEQKPPEQDQRKPEEDVPLARELDEKESSTAKVEAAASTLTEAKLKSSVTPPPKRMQKGHGRNIAKGKLALGVKHTYLETQTEVTNRKIITSDGTTITTQNVSLASIDVNEDPTSMHIDTIRIRLGLTDYLEIFADTGIAYDKLSDLEFAYGGGIRLNLFEASTRRSGEQFYLALQGEYLGGKLNEEYSTDTGYTWNKEADWQEFTSKMELGVTKSKFTAYVGGLYLLYREDTERRLLENLPAGLTSYVIQDELEEEYNYGFFGGIAYHFLPTVLLNIEGQVGNQKSVSGALEYHF
jgi:hypothetical protein